MERIRQCELAIVGGGLAGGLIALAIHEMRPSARVLLIEGGERLGGNHVWSLFDDDLTAEEHRLVAPMVAHRWADYDVAFPGHRRRLQTGYRSITSERFDAVLRERLPAERLLIGQRAIGVGPRAVVLADGRRIEADGVIDARGAASFTGLALGWQKFVGQELRLDAPHGLDAPVVMDATVSQHDGYRFVYVLPFGPNRLFVEDTYYSDTPQLERGLLGRRIDSYATANGWTVTGIGREEAGALPVVLDGDFEAFWRSGGANVAKAGTRAGLFHPTTGYSLPDAVRTARAVAAMERWPADALHARLHALAAEAWRARGFYRALDRMLFRAAAPAYRYKVLERFYTLDAGLIGRFYAARSTALDKARILAGRPPVPVGRAIAAIARRGVAFRA